jgi:hypothetical protein
MKYLKHLKHTLAKCAFSVTSSCCLVESRPVDAKLDATEVASAELTSGADLDGTELVGGSVCRAQRQRVDVGGAKLAANTGLSCGNAHRGWGMPVTRAGRVAA